jgi:hypothetical protein
MNDNPLRTTLADRAAAVVRVVVGAAPHIGPLLAEVVTAVIPGQKQARLKLWVEAFAARVEAIEGGLDRLNQRLLTDSGTDILEDGLLQATRAVSDARRHHLANLLANGLAGGEFGHDRMKTLTRLFDDLTDSELVLLIFYSEPPTFGSVWHKEMMDRHPDVLRPVSREMGSAQVELDRGALQEHHKATLERLGLLRVRDRTTSITSLGRLLVRLILDPVQPPKGASE